MSPTPPENVSQTAFLLRKTPRQSRAVATVDAILDAAARILVELGYAKASTNRIAELAGVSIGSLYEYFPGKEAIFAELRRREGLKFYNTLVDRQPDDPREAIRHIVRSRLAWVTANPALYAALEAEVPRSAIAQTEAWVYQDFMALSVTYLNAHKDELIPTVNADFLAELLMRTVSATVHGFALSSPARLDEPELAEELSAMIERYLFGWTARHAR